MTPTAHRWLLDQLEDIGNTRLQAAAFVLASPPLWRKLGGQLGSWPWDLTHPQAGGWSSSERCLHALARALADWDDEIPAEAILGGLSSLDSDNARYVRAAIAVATGARPAATLRDLVRDAAEA